MLQYLSERNKTLLMLVFIVVLSVSVSSFSFIGFLWGVFVFLTGMYLTIKNRNTNGEAHIFAAYIMAAEVFFRMTWAGLPWEFGKYAVIFLLLTGLVFDKHKRSFPFLIIAYMVLMLPAIYLTFEYYTDFELARKRAVFNLLGPLVLMISTLYFYRMYFGMKDFMYLSRSIVLGALSMGVLVFFNVGDYAAVEFTFSSNSDASGGFSGNQVATVFGLGILVLGINMVLKNRLFHYVWIDLSLLILFVFQGFMTFSRGGMMGAGIALLLGLFIYYFSNIEQLISFLRENLVKLLLSVIIGMSAFGVADDISGGNLSVRYFNVDERGFKKKDDYLTGRGGITKGDLQLFVSSNYVGVGPGVSILERPLHKNEAAHIEFTRMLAEHGVLGLIAMIIMLFLPLGQFLKLLTKPENQMIFISFIVLSMLTMTHAAMRLGMVGFFYGMAFIIIAEKVKEKGKIT